MCTRPSLFRRIPQRRGRDGPPPCIKPSHRFGHQPCLWIQPNLFLFYKSCKYQTVPRYTSTYHTVPPKIHMYKTRPLCSDAMSEFWIEDDPWKTRQSWSLPSCAPCWSRQIRPKNVATIFSWEISHMPILQRSRMSILASIYQGVFKRSSTFIVAVAFGAIGVWKTFLLFMWCQCILANSQTNKMTGNMHEYFFCLVWTWIWRLCGLPVGDEKPRKIVEGLFWGWFSDLVVFNFVVGSCLICRISATNMRTRRRKKSENKCSAFS